MNYLSHIKKLKRIHDPIIYFENPCPYQLNQKNIGTVFFFVSEGRKFLLLLQRETRLNRIIFTIAFYIIF